MDHRTERVANAITIDADGRQVGHYLGYHLHSSFQPIVKVSGPYARLSGYEGLIRPHSGRKLLTPKKLFQAVRRGDGFFVDWLCRTLHLHNFAARCSREYDIYINFDPRWFADLDKCRQEIGLLVTGLGDLAIDPRKVVCEIVEQRACDDDLLVAVVGHLRDAGIRIALDDYGVGYSDAHRLMMLRPDVVKLDATWCRKLLGRRETDKLVRTTIDQLRQAGIRLLYEGVETDDDMVFAVDNGIDYMQGFAIAEPTPVPCSHLVFTLPAGTAHIGNVNALTA